MTPCGAKTTKVECHQELGHEGMHFGLLAVGVDRFADIFWSDDWHVDTALPWVTELPMEAEMPIFPVVVYSRGEEASDFEDWKNS